MKTVKTAIAVTAAISTMVQLGWPDHTEVRSGRTDPFATLQALGGAIDKAAELAALTRAEFLDELHRRKVPACQVTPEELADEIHGV